jgi:hypothetical protein
MSRNLDERKETLNLKHTKVRKLGSSVKVVTLMEFWGGDSGRLRYISRTQFLGFSSSFFFFFQFNPDLVETQKRRYITVHVIEEVLFTNLLLMTG